VNRAERLDHLYARLARSRTVTRAALHARGISSALLAKRLAPTTLPEGNGEYRLLDELGSGLEVVVDVGANVGDWAEQALRRWPALQRLVCFEPVAWAAERLERRIGSDPRVTLVQSAVSDEAGTLTMWSEGVGGTMSSAVSGYSAESSQATEVRAVTLDGELGRLGIEHVDFLKIDAEGFDLHALRGARQALEQQRIDVIQFEYGASWHGAGSTLAEAFALLGGVGYTALAITPDGLRSFPLDWSSELFMYANFAGLSPRIASRFGPAPPVW
jgi:FkbM family methyltransferase